MLWKFGMTLSIESGFLAFSQNLSVHCSQGQGLSDRNRLRKEMVAKSRMIIARQIHYHDGHVNILQIYLH